MIPSNFSCHIGLTNSISLNKEFISKDTFKHPPLYPLPSREGRFSSPLSLEGLRLVEERARVRVGGFYELLNNTHIAVEDATAFISSGKDEGVLSEGGLIGPEQVWFQIEF